MAPWRDQPPSTGFNGAALSLDGGGDIGSGGREEALPRVSGSPTCNHFIWLGQQQTHFPNSPLPPQRSSEDPQRDLLHCLTKGREASGTPSHEAQWPGPGLYALPRPSHRKHSIALRGRGQPGCTFSSTWQAPGAVLRESPTQFGEERSSHGFLLSSAAFPGPSGSAGH